VGAEVTVDDLGAPHYYQAYARSNGPESLPDSDYDRSMIARVSVCSSGGSVYVLYMPKADGLWLAVLDVQENRLFVRSRQMLRAWMTVGDPTSQDYLSEVPTFSVSSDRSGGCRVVYIDPYKEALACYLVDVGDRGLRREDVPLPADLDAGMSRVLFDGAQNRVYVCSPERHGNVRPALYSLDLGSKRWAVTPIHAPWAPGPLLLSVRVLTPAVDGQNRLFGVISDLDGQHTSMVELTKAGFVKVSASVLEAFHIMPWAAVKDAKGNVHLFYPALDRNAMEGTTVLADSYEANGSWRTVTVDRLGKTMAGSSAYVALGQRHPSVPSRYAYLCFPAPLLGSDGRLHVVYYSEGRGALVQAVLADQRWVTRDFAAASHVVAMDAVEVDGKLAVVWAHGLKERLNASLVSLALPEERRTEASAIRRQ
jgi:hypothetical protein